MKNKRANALSKYYQKIYIFIPSVMLMFSSGKGFENKFMLFLHPSIIDGSFGYLITRLHSNRLSLSLATYSVCC
jgi:hypothetical protein